MTIAFTVPSVPVAQPRQRSRVVAAHGRTFTQNYTPTNSPVNAFKAAVQMAASAEYKGPPLEYPICIYLTFILPRPKSITKKRGDNPRVWCAKKPDFDNLAKSVTDALTGILWRDDSQLVSVHIHKMIANAKESPCVGVTVLQAADEVPSSTQRVIWVTT